MKIQLISEKISSPFSLGATFWRYSPKKNWIIVNSFFIICYLVLFNIGVTNDGYTIQQVLQSPMTRNLGIFFLLFNLFHFFYYSVFYYVFKNKFIVLKEDVIIYNDKALDIRQIGIHGSHITISLRGSIIPIEVWYLDKSDSYKLFNHLKTLLGPRIGFIEY